MKVYIKNEETNFTYPEDMKKILDYLNSHGKIMVSENTIESLYYDFSEERFCASWIDVDDTILEEFENWLIKKEI